MEPMHEIIRTLDPSIRFGPKSNGLRQGFIVTFKLPKTVHLYFFFSLFFCFFWCLQYWIKNISCTSRPPFSLYSFITQTESWCKVSNITQICSKNYVIYWTYASSLNPNYIFLFQKITPKLQTMADNNS